MPGEALMKALQSGRLDLSLAAVPASEPRRLAQKALRGGVVLLVARFGMQLVAWAVTLVVARLLMPSDYGVMTAGMVFLGLADLLADAGVGKALVQRKD